MRVKPSRSNVVCIVIFFIVPGIALVLLTLFAPAERQYSLWVAAPFACCLCFFPALYVLSQEVNVTQKDVSRRTLFGTNRIAILDLVSAYMIFGARGFRALELRTQSKRLSITNFAFSNTRLEEIQRHVVEIGGSAGHAIPVSRPQKIPTSAEAAKLLVSWFLLIMCLMVLFAAFAR